MAKINLDSFIGSVGKQGLKLEGIIVCPGGGETVSYRWVPERRRNVFSVSKSVCSIAIGMAVDEGKLRLGDRVTGAFPRAGSSTQSPSDRRWDSLTLEHLLTMNLGHPEFTRPQSVAEALSYELTRDPGSFFLYDNTCTFLASAMLTRATGQKVRDYLIDRLFGPLGIQDPYWPESADGHTIGATGLELSTSEMAAFGRFLLQKGSWNGTQLVSAAWIEAATRTQVPTRPQQDKPDFDLGYGYQFWMSRHGAYRCDGKDGQFIIIFPSLGAVIAINSDEENMKPILWTVWDEILPQL